MTRALFFNRRTDKAIMGSRFTNHTGEAMRIISKVSNSSPAFEAAELKGEQTLRETPAGRHKIEAKFYEADRTVSVLTIQKYNSASGPSDKYSFSFVGDEIQKLKEFLAGIETIGIESAQKRHITDEELNEIVLDRAQLNRAIQSDEEAFVEVLRNTSLRRDVVAVRYRKDQLDNFALLLNEPKFFADKMTQHSTSKPETLWQKFFERNRWIFGYGLSYQFLAGLDDKSLEQTVRGSDLTGPGKIVDSALKTMGAINSLCFVEIKTHETKLLSQASKRSGVWHPSAELAAATAQIQMTVQAAVEQIQEILRPTKKDGTPTGEEIFNVAPKSFLIVGSLDEFDTENGTNIPKFKSFELYRRSLHQPEVMTFDELYARARFIVSQSE